MSDSEPTPLQAAIAELGEEATDSRNLLVGQVQVVMVVNIPEGRAVTPAEAVEQMILTASTRGLGGYFYQVSDETDRTWFVRDGQIVEPEDLARLAGIARGDEDASE